jgi:hypothetical protein
MKDDIDDRFMRKLARLAVEGKEQKQSMCEMLESGFKIIAEQESLSFDVIAVGLFMQKAEVRVRRGDLWCAWEVETMKPLNRDDWWEEAARLLHFFDQRITAINYKRDHERRIDVTY